MSRTQFEEFSKKASDRTNYLKEELKRLRSGRAHPSLVEDIMVDAYGESQPLKNLANISVADVSLLTIQPWDKTVVDAILKAIQTANIGINPVPDGGLIRLPLPPMTEERRLEYVKLMKDSLEESRIAIRALRKDVLVGLVNEKKDGEIGEDDYNRMEKEVQKMVEAANAEIEEIGKKKEEELMTI